MRSEQARRFDYQTAGLSEQLLPSPREAVGSRRAELALRGRGWGVLRQTRCQRSKLIDPPSPTPPRHAQRRVEGGEITAHSFAISRPDMPEVCQKFPYPLDQRAQGTPGARCTRGLVCNTAQKNAHEHTGSAEAIRHSLRNGFNRLYRALPGEPGFLATVARAR
jgi:hypothetical protein